MHLSVSQSLLPLISATCIDLSRGRRLHLSFILLFRGAGIKRALSAGIHKENFLTAPTATIEPLSYDLQKPSTFDCQLGLPIELTKNSSFKFSVDFVIMFLCHFSQQDFNSTNKIQPIQCFIKVG